MEQKRIACFDIAKGIGIILVVWAHAKGPLNQYIYQFHMPLFFLISGYLFNPNNSFWEFTVKKIKSLYIPFVFWNLLVLNIKFFSDLADISRKVFFEKALEMLLALEKDGEFFGATWFLGALFIVSIVYKAFDEVLKGFRYKRQVITICFIIGAVIGFCINFPFMLSRVLILGGFFAAGFWIKENQNWFICCWKWYIGLIFFILFMIIGHYNYASMGINKYSSPVLFVAGACMMSYSVLFFSAYIDKAEFLTKVKELLCFLGRRSIDIVIWQFVFFRIVIMLQLFIDGKVITVHNVLKYYPVYRTEKGWWFVYTLAGLFLPVLWGNILRTGIWGRLLKKIHAV